MHTGLRWQLLCRAGFPPERRVQGGEHSVILLKSAPLSWHPRVLQDLPALGTLGLAEGLGRAVMEILTPSQAVSSDDPWNSFPCGQTSFGSLQLAHRVHFSRPALSARQAPGPCLSTEENQCCSQTLPTFLGALFHSLLPHTDNLPFL